MRNIDLFRFRQGLEALGTSRGSAKVAYALVVNLRRVRTITDDLEKLRASSSEFQKYDQKRLELVRKHATKDASGAAAVEADGVSAVIADPDALECDMTPLKKEYAAAIAEQRTKNQRFDEILQQEADFVPKPTVDYDQIAELNLTVIQLDGIFPIIKKVDFDEVKEPDLPAAAE